MFVQGSKPSAMPNRGCCCLGHRVPGRIMSLIILPQALRVIVPPLISQYLNITKNSSLAIAVGYMDITGTLGGITLNQTGRAIECILGFDAVLFGHQPVNFGDYERL
jgi:ABC-type amino acid transport system permease subunit